MRRFAASLSATYGYLARIRQVCCKKEAQEQGNHRGALGAYLRHGSLYLARSAMIKHQTKMRTNAAASCAQLRHKTEIHAACSGL